jgi:hypothetical protein
MEHTWYYYTGEMKALFIGCGRWRDKIYLQNIDWLTNQKTDNPAEEHYNVYCK